MKNLLIALIALFTITSCSKYEEAKETLEGSTFELTTQTNVAFIGFVRSRHELKFVTDRNVEYRVYSEDGTLYQEEFFIYEVEDRKLGGQEIGDYPIIISETNLFTDGAVTLENRKGPASVLLTTSSSNQTYGTALGFSKLN